MAIAIDRLGDTKGRLGGSPVQSAREGCLHRIDALAGLLRRLDAESGRRDAFAVPAPIGSFGLCRSGGGVVPALRDGFYRYEFAAAFVTPLARLPIDHPDIRSTTARSTARAASSRAACTWTCGRAGRPLQAGA